ncbi:hypothetical protein AOCH_003760 [Aspergillus ochraceoroseus]|uniref:DUF6594 domain-containing protein n=1 Tax=Aspergillus ochraceoroseus TaxID=138278 RepID=A0A0F8TXH8_9EURO|nr:hypothetical protein AOCH_003760 [Aspergillus ochraceoroseus]
MPLYSSTSRSKKPKKDVTKRASASSTVSTTSKGSKNPAEKHKKDSPRSQPSSLRESGASGVNSKAQPPPPPPPLGKVKGHDVNPPNVFEYLDSDSDPDSDSDSDSEFTSSDEDELSCPSIPPTSQSKTGNPAASRKHIPATQPGVGRSRTSSVRSKDSAGFTHPPGAFDASPLPATLQLARQNGSHRRPSSTDGTQSVTGSLNDGTLPPEHRNLELVPEDYYSRNPTTLHRPSFPPSPPQSPEEDLHRSGRKIRRTTKSSRLPTGYGLLAWRLSEPAEGKEPRLPPLYRRFDDVNHRVLLYLQDEISQLEEELRVLDDYDEMQRRANAEQEGAKLVPASRRMDVQAQVYSSLHYRREEVMGALIQKTEQYNHALGAYSKVLQTLPRATAADTEIYRAWMKENNPIAVNEMRFLDHAKDLVSLTPQAATVSNITSPVYTAIIIASAAIILPLLAFGMISEFTGRILVAAVVGGASAAVAAHYSTGAEHLVKSQDGWRCALVYFGFMTIAAICI